MQGWKQTTKNKRHTIKREKRESSYRRNVPVFFALVQTTIDKFTFSLL